MALIVKGAYFCYVQDTRIAVNWRKLYQNIMRLPPAGAIDGVPAKVYFTHISQENSVSEGRQCGCTGGL